MKGDVLTRSTGRIPFDRLFVLGTRNMASSGRLLGLPLPPVPSHLSDFMPACVRSTHTGGARECSSLAQVPDSPLKAPRTVLQEGNHAESPSPLGWAPHFSLGSNEGDITKASHPGAEARPTTPPEVEDMSGTFGEEADENSHGQCRGLRSTLSSMLSLDKRSSFVPGHASQFMMDMSTSFTRQIPKADSKNCVDILKGSPVSELGVTKGDPSWMEDKFNDAWGIEPWHSDQRNILMKTLHIMRCDIESLKMVLRSLDLPAARGGPLDPHLCETQGHMPNTHPVMMMGSNSAMAEMERISRKPSKDEQIENRIDQDMELSQTAGKDHSSEADKDLSVSEVPSSEKEDYDDTVSSWTHDPQKRKQWWRELLKALGMAVWVITGAVLVAKVIGVPNLGVSQNVAYGFWGRSEDNSKSGQGIPTGVVELNFLNFNEYIMRRPTFVMFYAPWCPHCQRLHPVWEQLAGVLNRKGYDVQLAIVDATKHTRLADKYEIVGFPSLIMFKRGHPVGRHRGARDIDTLMSFIDYNK